LKKYDFYYYFFQFFCNGCILSLSNHKL